MLTLAERVNLNNPKRSEFTSITFNQVGECLCILLLLVNGRRPETIGFVTDQDIRNIKRNIIDPKLFTVTVQEFVPDRSGKTGEVIRLSLDSVATKLLFR